MKLWGGGEFWVFYEEFGIKRTSDGHVRVWTKSLSQKDLDKAELSPAVKDQTIKRLLRQYVPVAARNQKLEKERLATMIMYEAFANEGVVPSTIQVLFEIDCKKEMTRMLSVHVSINKRTSSTDKPTVWAHIAPETNAARLSKALCQAKAGTARQ